MENSNPPTVSGSYMVLFHKEIASRAKNMLDISTKPSLLYASSLSSSKPSVIILPLLLLKLASLAMLSIQQLMHTAGSGGLFHVNPRCQTTSVV